MERERWGERKVRRKGRRGGEIERIYLHLLVLFHVPSVVGAEHQAPAQNLELSPDLPTAKHHCCLPVTTLVESWSQKWNQESNQQLWSGL